MIVRSKEREGELKMTRPKPSKKDADLAVAPSTMEYMMGGVRRACEAFRARLAGSAAERAAQEFFKEELGAYADEARLEEFTLHPRAFMGFIPIAALLCAAAIPCFLFSGGSTAVAVLGAALPLLATFMFLFEFLFYRDFVDFLFPKRKSCNVYALRRPGGERKRRIVFVGHTDAANEWAYSRLGEKKALAPVIFGSVGGMLVSLVANIVNAVYHLASRSLTPELPIASKWEGGWLAWSVAVLLTLAPTVAILFFINYRVVVDGANDTLSANYVAMSVLKEMHDSGLRFENTEVCCLLTGAEESGLRGAKAFARDHQAEFTDPGVETVFIAMDTLREVEELRVNNIGCTGTVVNDYAVGDLIREAARACGVELPDTELYPGAIDSEAFSMYGLRASGFTGCSHEAKRYYHTRMDTPDNMDPDCLALSLNICKQAARLFDEKGMAGYDQARAGK
jgi:hypothetical protein